MGYLKPCASKSIASKLRNRIKRFLGRKSGTLALQRRPLVSIHRTVESLCKNSIQTIAQSGPCMMADPSEDNPHCRCVRHANPRCDDEGMKITPLRVEHMAQRDWMHLRRLSVAFMYISKSFHAGYLIVHVLILIIQWRALDRFRCSRI